MPMETLLKCRKFDVIRRPIRTPDGKEHAYEIVTCTGAVVVLPLLDEGRRVVMIRNFRYTLDRELWELPAGMLDKPGEAPIDAAARELEEETGHRAGTVEPFGKFYTSPGILTEVIHAFVATDLEETEQALEPTEQIRVEILDFAETLRMIRDGRIVDAKTIVTLLRWQIERGDMV